MKNQQNTFENKDEYPAFQPLSGWSLATAFLLVLVELCWVLAWYRLFVQAGNLAVMPIAVLTLGLVSLASYGLSYLGEYMHLLRDLKLVLLALLLWVSIFVSVRVLLPPSPQSLLERLVELDPGVVLVSLLVIWLWWRGVSLARVSMRPEIAWRRFELGLIFFMIIIFVAYRTGGEAPGLGWFAAFLLLGFLAVLSGRAAYVNVVAGEAHNPLDRRWMSWMVGLLGLVVLMATILGSLMTGQLSLLLDWLSAAIRFVVAVFLLIAAIPALLFGTLLEGILTRLSEAIGLEADDFLSPEPVSEIPYVLPEEQAPRELPLFLQNFLHILPSLIFWGLLVAGLIWLFMILRSRGERLWWPTRGNMESLLEPGEAGKLFRKAVQDAFDDLVGRLRRRPPPPGIARIRQIYIQLLDYCADLELQRPDSKTPLEFLPMVGEELPDVEPELDDITQAYVRVRYGEMPEAPDEVAKTERAWDRIRSQSHKRSR